MKPSLFDLLNPVEMVNSASDFNEKSFKTLKNRCYYNNKKKRVKIIVIIIIQGVSYLSLAWLL